MALKSILVHFDVDAHPDQRLAFSRQLAVRFDAELRCVSFADPMVPYAVGGNAAMATKTIYRDIAAIEARQRDMHEYIMQQGPFAIHVDWRAEIADPSTAVISQAASADLVVLFRPDIGQAYDLQRMADLGTVLLAAGRPLLLPCETMTDLKARTIAIAWKDTREARRAVADAIPLLRQADDVILLSVREAGQASDHPEQVVRHLIQHAVRARSVIENPQAAGIAESIVDAAVRLQADLIVAGGYGHSRFRERIFGGVTEYLLRHCPLHLLLSN